MGSPCDLFIPFLSFAFLSSSFVFYFRPLKAHSPEVFSTFLCSSTTALHLPPLIGITIQGTTFSMQNYCITLFAFLLPPLHGIPRVWIRKGQCDSVELSTAAQSRSSSHTAVYRTHFGKLKFALYQKSAGQTRATTVATCLRNGTELCNSQCSS